MTYLALVSGARGLLYYCYHVYTKYDKSLKEKGQWPWVLGGYLPDREPELWQAFIQSGKDLAVLTPALCRGGSREWHEDSVFFREIAPAKEAPGFLLAVNSSGEKTARLESKIGSLAGKSVQLEELNGGPPLQVARGKGALDLKPMEVRIYKLPAK